MGSIIIFIKPKGVIKKIIIKIYIKLYVTITFIIVTDIND